MYYRLQNVAEQKHEPETRVSAAIIPGFRVSQMAAGFRGVRVFQNPRFSPIRHDVGQRNVNTQSSLSCTSTKLFAMWQVFNS